MVYTGLYVPGGVYRAVCTRAGHGVYHTRAGHGVYRTRAGHGQGAPCWSWAGCTVLVMAGYEGCDSYGRVMRDVTVMGGLSGFDVMGGFKRVYKRVLSIKQAETSIKPA